MYRIILALSIVALFSTSCSNDSTGESPLDTLVKDIASGESSDEGGIFSGNKFASPAYIEKYNQYIDFGNRFHSRVIDSYDRYFGWADIEKGPKSNAKRATRGIYSMYDTAIDGLEKAIESKPKMEVMDPLMQDVFLKAKSLNAVVGEAGDYYEREDFKDDDFAKGELLHVQLINAFDDYFASYDKMSTEFYKIQNELFAYEAEKYKEEGNVIRYNMMMTLNQAEGVLNLLGVGTIEELKKIDLTVLEEKAKSFRKYFDEMEKLSKDESQLKKEFESHKSTYLRMYIESGVKFIKATRDLKERVEKNDFKYGITHPNIPDDGSSEDLYNVYSELIENYNRLQ